MDRKIILIGGAPTAGKSVLAAQLAKHLNIPWMSTDQIRSVMQLVARREDHPKLFNPEGYDAERFLTEFTAAQIVQMEMEQGEAVWPGIRLIIGDDYTSKASSFIVEGVSILPHLVAQDFKDTPHVRAIFLVDENTDRVRDVVYTRGLWDYAHTYSDDVKEKEVEWALLFSHKLKAEAEQFGFPCIELEKNSNDVQKILDMIKRT